MSSALAQLGLLDPAKFPVAGAEAARKMLDPASVPSNLLIKADDPGRTPVRRAAGDNPRLETGRKVLQTYVKKFTEFYLT